jgi:glycosyltransferase involved in cell wall biosynthesis
MRVKIVDAWCWGVPIAATTVGAEGIDVRNGENILIADQPPELARALIDLLKNPKRGEAMRAQGRAWVEDRYNWQTVYPAWDDVYTRVLGT